MGQTWIWNWLPRAPALKWKSQENLMNQISHSGTGYFWRMSTEPWKMNIREYLEHNILNYSNEDQNEENGPKICNKNSNLPRRLFLHFRFPQHNFIVHTLKFCNIRNRCKHQSNKDSSSRYIVGKKNYSNLIPNFG